MSSYIMIFNCYLLHIQEKSEIVDKHDAKPLELNGGCIEFENVDFRCTSIFSSWNTTLLDGLLCIIVEGLLYHLYKVVLFS